VVHPNVVLGLRNIGIGLGNGVTTVHFGPDLRLRGMISASVGWSASVGAVVQIHVEGDERAEGRHRPEGYDEETGWALYPYVGAGLHYFPARCWSLDVGVQGGLAVGTRRFLFDQEGTQEDLTFALEYVGGITWYH